MFVSYTTQGVLKSSQFEVSNDMLDVLTDGLWQKDCIDEVAMFDPVYEKRPKGFSPHGDTYIGEQFRLWLDQVGFVPGLIVLRGGGQDFSQAVQHDDMLRSIIETAKLSVATLVSGFESNGFTMEYKKLAGSKDFDFTPFLNVLRHLEYTGLLRQHGSVLYSGESSHFHLPSGDHSDTFVRMSDTVQIFSAVRRIAEWIMPYVSEKTIVFADSPSLSPLLLQIQLLAKQHFSTNLIVDCLQAYPSSRVELDDALREFRYRSNNYMQTPMDDTVYLISVNGSGKLAKQLEEEVSFSENARLLVLCDTAMHKSPECSAAFETMSILPVAKWPTDTNGRCQECKSRHPIQIHPSSFERVATAALNSVSLKVDIVKNNRWFWEAANRTDAIRFHHNSPNTSGRSETYRHFGIYLDVAKLLTDEIFRGKCVEALKRLQGSHGGKTKRPPSLVLIPDNDTYDAMSELVVEAFWGEDAQVATQRVVKTTYIESVSDRLRELNYGEWILLADDAIVTGTRLRNWRERIQQISNQLGEEILTSGFVALARPDTMETFQPVKNRFKDRSLQDHLDYGHLMQLPPSGVENCPWCQELQLIARFGRQMVGSAKDHADQRLSVITRSPMCREDLILGADQLKMNQMVGALWGDLSPSTAFAAAAAATWTQGAKLANSWSGATMEVFDVLRFVKSYMEPQLRSGMLRTLDPVQTRSPKQDALISDEFIRWRESRKRGFDGIAEELAELGLAGVRGIIPTGEFIRFAEGYRADLPALEMVCQMIQLNTLMLSEVSTLELDQTTGESDHGGSQSSVKKISRRALLALRWRERRR